MTDGGQPTDQVVVVCTGNVIRSPFAAAALEARLRDRGVGVSVTSAGLLTDGRPAEPHILTVGEQHGLDLSEHVSRRISPSILAPASLVIGMSRRHLREVAAMEPSVWPRTFTLRELSRRATQHGPRPAHFSLAQWAARLSADRTAAEMVADDPADDIDDPIGADRATFRAVVDEIDECLERVVRLLWPAPQTG